jgi:hypothetical protein
MKKIIYTMIAIVAMGACSKEEADNNILRTYNEYTFIGEWECISSEYTGKNTNTLYYEKKIHFKIDELLNSYISEGDTEPFIWTPIQYNEKQDDNSTVVKNGVIKYYYNNLQPLTYGYIKFSIGQPLNCTVGGALLTEFNNDEIKYYFNDANCELIKIWHRIK